MSEAATQAAHYDRSDAVSTREPSTPGSVMSVKGGVILIRWPVVLISASLILFRNQNFPATTLFNLLIVLYALSNAALYFVDQTAFHKVRFNVFLIGLDTLVLTISLWLNGQTETNFFLAYFLLIIICCIFENPNDRDRVIRRTVRVCRIFFHAG